MFPVDEWKFGFHSPQAGRYDESLKHLDTLQELSKGDYKVVMNKAVAEFFRTGQTTTGTLKQTLMTIRNRVTADVSTLSSSTDLFVSDPLDSSLYFSFTHHLRMLTVWTMWRTACCTITRPSFTITCVSTLRPSPSERSSTSSSNRLVRYKLLFLIYCWSFLFT